MASPLISAEELRSIIGRVVLLDARPGPANYAAGHLPNALHVDLDHSLSTAFNEGHDPARGGRHPLPSAATFARQLGDWGISPNTDVVVYDAASGANAAARVWWMLRSLGHERVAVLDGGLASAIAAGLNVIEPHAGQVSPTGSSVAARQTTPYPESGWAWPTVDLDAVEVCRTSSAWIVLDVRAAERFRGEIEPFDPVAGHIPGAKNLPFSENLEANGRFKSPAALRAQYERLLGAIEPSHLIVQCGSGVTACHTLLALDIAGLRGAALYVGSWSEWCRTPREQAKGS
jgi:thiosulfate/3-mercaptopyruvate sulfurtransferase